MREISLSRGLVALVDDEDYEQVSKHKWFPMFVRDRTYVRSNTAGLLHRFILGSPESVLVVDHINDDGLDNRRENLRFLSNSANIRRSSKYRENAGVRKREGYPVLKKPWTAEASINGRNTFIGYFATEEEAVQARRVFLAGADK